MALRRGRRGGGLRPLRRRGVAGLRDGNSQARAFSRTFDRLPAEVAEASARWGLADGVAIDHVYFYSNRQLRHQSYLRFHVVRQADFEAYRQKIGGHAIEHPETFGPLPADYDAIKSWWDWKDRSDCSVSGLGEEDIEVFDKARSVVYLLWGSG